MNDTQTIEDDPILAHVIGDPQEVKEWFSEQIRLGRELAQEFRDRHSISSKYFEPLKAKLKNWDKASVEFLEQRFDTRQEVERYNVYKHSPSLPGRNSESVNCWPDIGEGELTTTDGVLLDAKISCLYTIMTELG